MMRPIAECGVGRASTHRVKGVRARGRVWGGFCVETSTYAGSIGWVYVAWVVIDDDMMMT
jgi:hypothetical protein